LLHKKKKKKQKKGMWRGNMGSKKNNLQTHRGHTAHKLAVNLLAVAVASDHLKHSFANIFANCFGEYILIQLDSSCVCFVCFILVVAKKKKNWSEKIARRNARKEKFGSKKEAE
jgi:hypothetical protein